MQGLNEFATQEHCRNVLKGEQLHIEALSSIKMRLADFLYATHQKTVCSVVCACRIAAERIQQRPFPTTIAGFFQQFALSSGKRRGIGLFQNSAWYFPCRLAKTVTILAFQNDIIILGNGNDVHPIGIFQHIVFGNNPAIWKFKTFLSHC